MLVLRLRMCACVSVCCELRVRPRTNSFPEKSISFQSSTWRACVCVCVCVHKANMFPCYYLRGRRERVSTYFDYRALARMHQYCEFYRQSVRFYPACITLCVAQRRRCFRRRRIATQHSALRRVCTHTQALASTVQINVINVVLQPICNIARNEQPPVKVPHKLLACVDTKGATHTHTHAHCRPVPTQGLQRTPFADKSHENK